MYRVRLRCLLLRCLLLRCRLLRRLLRCLLGCGARRRRWHSKSPLLSRQFLLQQLLLLNVHMLH